MKKRLLIPIVTIIAVLSIMVTSPALSREIDRHDGNGGYNNGLPFVELWNKIAQLFKGLDNLQTQITNIQLTPGPQGEPGENGISILWLGTCEEAPADPSVNNAYYNATDGISYVFDGTSWQILAKDGSASDTAALEARVAALESLVTKLYPGISISDSSAYEDAGYIEFTISLTEAALVPVTFSYSTSDGNAVAGTDYEAVAGGTSTIAVGETSTTVSVVLSDDTDDENNETFFVNLDSVDNTVISDGQATGTIENDDAPLPDMVIFTYWGDPSESSESAVLKVVLSSAAPKPVSFTYTTADATATAGEDYAGEENVFFTMPAGATTGTFTITFLDDSMYEGNEIFYINIDNVMNAVLDNIQVAVKIADDDYPVVYIDEWLLNVPEAQGEITISATISDVELLSPYYVHWDTASRSATAGEDFVYAEGELVFEPGGELTQYITIYLLPDDIPEETEYFEVSLVDGVRIYIEDDEPLSLHIESPATVYENESYHTVYFTVSLSKSSTEDVTFTWATSGGTASEGYDYSTGDKTYTIPAGETYVLVCFSVEQDYEFENDEYFIVFLENTNNATWDNEEGVVWIINVD